MPSTDPGSPARHVSLRSAFTGVVATLVYACGAIFAPTLHQAFHEPNHVHLAESIVELPHHADEHEHEYPREYEHEHEHPREYEHGHEHQREHEHRAPEQAPDAEHGASSVWHFGAALSDHLDRVPAVADVLSLVPAADAPRAGRPRAVAVEAPHLRGPPFALRSNA